ncbi:aKG-HExxH-type peptide beta-hydroxylase [Polymorphospora rubra]|uniref:HEXXH motif domain-containing protein n=1 Tax=Polymorphospora rubra TaxID=338584 RepID=A0A810MX05_9ACTN|nr:HEXXH motif-containing putative peptide modification protein [Polymorphospora rubra]BCJ65706.1 hypothetical protein Prubr_27270 [Polymorphospora rubra]
MIDPVELFGGMPFANPDFQPERLLAATSVVRGAEARRHGLAIEGTALFDPRLITKVRQQHLTQDIPSRAPTSAQNAQVEETLGLIARSVPHFAPLLQIPIRFRILENSMAISASSFAWPQHVFLGPEAFGRPAQLAEQITHEMCHCWLYFMEEVTAVQAVSERVLRLPSGTANRDAAEVLGALHVAVTLQLLWGRLEVSAEERHDRVVALRTYADGCIELLRGAAASYLTGAGHRLTHDLVRIHERLSREVTPA